MLTEQDTMWEVISPQVENITAVGLFDLDIKSTSSLACVGEFQSATTMNAIVMVGEDRGAGNRLLNSFSFNNMMLCFILLGTVQGFAIDWVSWGTSSGFCHQIAPEVVEA